MPSRAEWGRRLERALRVVGYGGLLAALFLAVQARSTTPGRREVSPAMLPGYLAESVAGMDSIAVEGDTALDPVYRDWLAAVRVSGRAVTWRGSIPPTAIEIDPIVDPGGGHRVLVASPPGPVRLLDSLGMLDSTRASGGGAGFETAAIRGAAQAIVSGQRAVAARRDSLSARRIAVLGRPTWETKFVIAALEERGWLVDARIPLTPDTAVVQGTPLRLDTARVAAVVALDEAAGAQAASIRKFVLEGGGLVLGPGAAKLAVFASLRVGESGARLAPLELEPPADDPRRGLALVPVSRLEPGGIVLERRGGEVALAARRVGLGRVLQLGYEDSWRWRMAGPEGAVLAHRRWWSRLVGSVAYRATIRGAAPVSAHDAPLARTIARLGPPDSTLRQASGPRSGREPPSGFLFGLAIAALVAEWASRRWRGAV